MDTVCEVITAIAYLEFAGMIVYLVIHPDPKYPKYQKLKNVAALAFLIFGAIRFWSIGDTVKNSIARNGIWFGGVWDALFAFSVASFWLYRLRIDHLKTLKEISFQNENQNPPASQ